MASEKLSVINYLRKKYGGQWEYDRSAYQWRQVDGSLYAHKVASGLDHNGEYTGWVMYLYDTEGNRTSEMLPFWKPGTY